MRVAVLTLSDTRAAGKAEDTAGGAIREMVWAAGGTIVSYEVIPDERGEIESRLASLADSGEADIILTTGGTGLGPRDVTPEATLAVAEREVPGLTEAIRARSLEKAPTSMLSRAVAAQRGKAIIVNLPGSERAARECLDVILGVLPHAVEMMAGKGH